MNFLQAMHVVHSFDIGVRCVEPGVQDHNPGDPVNVVCTPDVNDYKRGEGHVRVLSINPTKFDLASQFDGEPLTVKALASKQWEVAVWENVARKGKPLDHKLKPIMLADVKPDPTGRRYYVVWDGQLAGLEEETIRAIQKFGEAHTSSPAERGLLHERLRDCPAYMRKTEMEQAVRVAQAHTEALYQYLLRVIRVCATVTRNPKETQKLIVKAAKCIHKMYTYSSTPFIGWAYAGRPEGYYRERLLAEATIIRDVPRAQLRAELDNSVDGAPDFDIESCIDEIRTMRTNLSVRWAEGHQHGDDDNKTAHEAEMLYIQIEQDVERAAEHPTKWKVSKIDDTDDSDEDEDADYEAV